MKKKNKIPTIIAVVALVVATFLGVLLVNSRQVFRIGASAELAPKDVRVSNISDLSISVSWTTDKQTSGFVNYGESANSLGKIAYDEVGDSSFIHYVNLSNLKPQTTYFFKINSGGENFDNNDTAWQITTGGSLTKQDQSFLISGSVLTATGNPSKNSIVYINAGGYLLSTLTSDKGTFVIQLANTRASNLSSYLPIDPAKTLLDISIQAGQDGVATAQIYPQSAQPIPPIIIGKTSDFRNLPPSTEGTTPDASLEVPQNLTQESRFLVPDEIATPSSKIVTLDSIKDGEIVTSTQPEFFGEGPTGTDITITVESDPITDNVKVDSSGDWVWNLPQTLEEGIHKITITWKDAQGITRTLTRNFVVQAGEIPAFVSTPSASLTPSPTATSFLTSSPSATAIPIPASGT
ncbi:fibronectin type III domain-containing protein, partial [Patescibacteria group bacterium]